MSSHKRIVMKKIGIVIVIIIFIIGLYFSVIFTFESRHKHTNKQIYIGSPIIFRELSSISNGTSTNDRRHSGDIKQKGIVVYKLVSIQMNLRHPRSQISKIIFCLLFLSFI